MFYTNATPSTYIYTLSLHDGSSDLGLETLVIIMVANKYAFLQITRRRFLNEWEAFKKVISKNAYLFATMIMRSEERFSRNAETDLVCRLLLEKKKRAE